MATPSYAIVCTGLGNVFRGYESSTYELYSHLKSCGDFRLYAGGEQFDHGGEVLWNVPREAAFYGWLPGAVASFYRRYQIECWTAGRSLLKALRMRPVDVVFTPDHLLAELLLRARKHMTHAPKIIFSNGAPFPASYCLKYDVVHQKSLVDYKEGIALYGDLINSYLIPNAFDAKALEQPREFDRITTRKRYGLPIEKKIVLSLAALQTTHKRLDWLIDEFADLPPGEFHLLLAGAKTEETVRLNALAHRDLPAGNFTILTVRPALVPELIWSSDLVVLCSLSEGFPRAVAEAMGARRFVLVHPHPNNQWIVDNTKCYVDMTSKGALRARLLEYFNRETGYASEVEQNYRRFRNNFTWDVLTPRYLEMFRAAA